MFESENIEFKAKLLDEIYKEVITFANTDDGNIYIGVYVKQGVSSTPASQELICKMIKDTDGDQFEDMCTIE